MALIISPLLRIQNQLRIFHWQTNSYAEHKAFGKAYESLDELVDTFVESYFGKYGKVKAKLSYNIVLENYGSELTLFVDESIGIIKALGSELDVDKDSELLNIVDEMLAELDKLKYLLTLK